MKKIYWFITDHIRVILFIMILLIVPDLLLPSPFAQIHLGILFALCFFVLCGLIIWRDEDDYLDDDLEIDRFEGVEDAPPCSYCAPRKDLPRHAPNGTFTVWDHGIWHKSYGQWECADIDYCPMCGRNLEE